MRRKRTTTERVTDNGDPLVIKKKAREAEKAKKMTQVFFIFFIFFKTKTHYIIESDR